MGKVNSLLIAIVFLASMAPGVSAQGVRQFLPIPTPGTMPPGMSVVAAVQPVAPDQVADSAERVMKAWSSGELEKHLGDDLYDKSRLTDAIAEKVPRDATIRLLALGGSQTLRQFQGQERNGVREISSTVAVTATTQIEFNDPARGYRRLEGVNEYLIRITEEVSTQGE